MAPITSGNELDIDAEIGLRRRLLELKIASRPSADAASAIASNRTPTAI